MTQGVQDLRLIKDVIMREIHSQGQGASAISSHADRYADIAVRQLGAINGHQLVDSGRAGNEP